jgi:hypothetical protein
MCEFDYTLTNHSFLGLQIQQDNNRENQANRSTVLALAWFRLDTLIN